MSTETTTRTETREYYTVTPAYGSEKRGWTYGDALTGDYETVEQVVSELRRLYASDDDVVDAIIAAGYVSYAADPEGCELELMVHHVARETDIVRDVDDDGAEWETVRDERHDADHVASCAFTVCVAEVDDDDDADADFCYDGEDYRVISVTGPEPSFDALETKLRELTA